MNDRQKYSYEALDQRLRAAESALQAIREGEVDAIIGEHDTLVVRLAETEKALKESEAKLKTILDSLPDTVLEIDSDMTIQWANKSALDLNPNAVGQTCYRAYSGKEEICDGCICRRALETGKIEMGIIYQPELQTAGESYWENICVPLKDKEGHRSRVIEVSRNVTERELSREKEKRLQQLLVHAQKMEAIATLTGGIAHDYNNLLSIIMGNLSLAMTEATPGSDLADDLIEAEKAARKAGVLTHELMALSRGGAPVRELGRLNHLLYASADVVPKDSGISIALSIPADLSAVPHDARKIDAVFRNLVTNAMEAMPDGGNLTIGAENLELGEEAPDIAPSLRPGAYVKITIEDQGRGIPEEHMDRLFDPYFSTKPMGVQKGMGLGLATAYAIVQKHGGHLTVASTPGLGTAVHIYLPASTGPESAQRTAHSAKREGPNAPSPIDHQPSPIRRILVMDDEEMLLDLARQMVERLGSEAETVKEGAAAIAVYKERMDAGEPFDAVILDLTIEGGMGGLETIRELLKIDPEVKAVVASGHSGDVIMFDCEAHGFKAAMPKPYQLKDLEQALEKLID